MRVPAIAAPLQHRDFRLLWTGQTISAFGNNVRAVALPIQLFAIGASPLELGIAAALNTSATVVFVLIGGAVADRASRRTLIIASDVAGAIGATALMVLSAAGELRVEHAYVAAIGFGVTDAFLSPAYGALVTELVPPDVLRASNAVRVLGRSVARIVGPSVGGLTVAFAGPAVAFGIDAFTFVLSFATLLAARASRSRPGPRGALVREIRGGVAHVASVGWLWSTIGYFMLVNVAYAGHGSVLTPLLVRDQLASDARVLGWIRAAYGAGTIFASIAIAQLATRRPAPMLFAFEILAGASVLVIGLIPTLPVVIGAMALAGAALASSTVVWQATLQRHVPPQLLGRVMSIDLLGNSLINPVAPLAAAALTSAIGAAATFAVAGAYATTLAAVGFVTSPLRAVQSSAVDPPRAVTTTRDAARADPDV